MELSLKDLKELFGAKDSGSSPWEIGRIYLIRTVTMIDTGRLVAVGEHELVLEDAAWAAAWDAWDAALSAARAAQEKKFREMFGTGEN